MNDEQISRVQTLSERGYLPESDAVKVLGKTKWTLWRLRRDGRLPYYRISGSIYYAENDLIAYVESCRK